MFNFHKFSFLKTSQASFILTSCKFALFSLRENEKNRESGPFLKVCLQTDEPNWTESEEFHSPSQHLQTNAALVICSCHSHLKKPTDSDFSKFANLLNSIHLSFLDSLTVRPWKLCFPSIPQPSRQYPLLLSS